MNNQQIDTEIKALRKRQARIELEARTLIEQVTDETPAAKAKEIEQEYDSQMAEHDKLEARIDRLSGEKIDEYHRPGSGDNTRSRHLEDAYDLSGSFASSEWRDVNTGRTIRTYQPNERMATEASPQFSVGAAIRAMIAGPRDEAERRALSEGTDSAGGYTVPDILNNRVIDALRARSIAVQAGSITVPLRSDNNLIARIGSDPVAGWRAENASVAESDPTFSQVALVPKTLAVMFKVSRELLQDSVNIDMAIEMALVGAFAAQLDAAVFYGTGSSSQPTGIKNISGIGSVEMGTNGAALADYSQILTALQTLEDANGGMATALCMAPRTKYALANLQDTTNQPMQAPALVSQVPILSSTNFPVDETQGTATDASTILLGDFSRCLIGVRSELRIEVLRERYADNYQFGILAAMRADVAVEQPASFVELIGITP